MTAKKQLSLRSKILLLIISSSFLIALIFSFVLMSSVNQSKKVAADLISRSNKIEDLGRINFLFKSEVQMWKDVLIRGSDPESFNKYTAEMKKFRTEARDLVEDLKKRMTDPADDAKADSFLNGENELYESYMKAIDTHLKGPVFDYKAADKDLKGKDRPVVNSLKELSTVFEEKMHKTADESIQKLESEMRAGFSIALCAVFLVLVISWLMLNRISKRLTQVSHSISEASNNIDGAVSEITPASEKLAMANTEAAASIEETSASLEEIASMVRKSNDTLDMTNKLATQGNESAGRAEAEMRELIESMNEIKTSSAKMEEIIAVIDDIAFQTNLLALNASVEAARAGEQGKGFAVVADAVRTLAQRSATSARDISALIKDSVAKVEGGGQIAARNEVILKDIVTVIKKMAELTSDTASISHQQLQGIEQISKAVGQLDHTSQTNAASAEETAGASMLLQEQSVKLQNVMSDLRSVIHG